MKKIKFYNILIAFSLATYLASYGQEQVITLSSYLTGTQDKVARDAVILENGFSYTASGSYTFTARIDETLMCDADYLTGDGIIDNDGRTILTSYDVGATPGAFSVNSYGAANYSIPIIIPPGIKGMQPNVSVGYSGSSGSGLLGVGWNLSATSSIRRVPRDYTHDGETEGIELSYDDKFALDGNRLILKDDTYAYGYDNSTYETEFKNFSTITADGTTGNGPTSFQVTTVDGRTLLYGNTTESRDLAGTTAYVWRLTKVTDANNNYMEYIYDKTTSGETYLKTIKYTGNTSTSLTPLNEIHFIYEEKDDKNFFYLQGTKIEKELLLRRIRVKAEDVSYRVYDFEYLKSNNTTFLNKISETNNLGGEYNATTINWNNLPSQQITSMSSSMKPTKYQGDFDGDGLTDYVDIIDDIYVATYHNNGDGSFTGDTVSELSDTSLFIGAVIADYNGDGKEDLTVIAVDRCTWNPAGVELYCEDYLYMFYKNNGQGFDLQETYKSEYCDGVCGIGHGIYPLPKTYDKYIFPGDFNGDGFSDVIIYDNLYLGALDMANNMQEIFGIEKELGNFAIDINGDGKTEFVTYDESEMEVHSFNGSSMDIITEFNLSTDRENIYFGDFNGDGQSDLLYFASSDWKIRYSEGNGFATAVDAPISSTTDPSESDNNYLYYTGDVDGNGKADIIELYYTSSARYIKIYYSNGNNSFTVQSNTITGETFDRNITTLANITKDSQLDLILEDDGNVYSFYPFNYSRKVSTIMDGMGIKTAINYGRLTENDTSFYTENASVSFPLNIYTIPATVVTSYTQKSMYIDSVEINNVSLAYEDAVVHNQGFGFLGFKKVTRTNTNGNESESEFAFDLPQYTPYRTQSKSFFNNTLLATNYVSKSYKAFSLNGGINYFFYTDTAKSTDVLNGNTTTTVNTYDANANLTSKKSTAQDGSYTEVVPDEYVANGSYHPTIVTTIRKHKDDTNVFTDSTKYTYNNEHNLTQVIEHFNKSNQVTTVFTDSEIDDYGNPTEIIQTPLSMNDVTTTFTYDETKRFVSVKTISQLGSEYFTYNILGELLKKEDVYGNYVKYHYDGWGRLSHTIDDLGNSTEVELAWASGTIPDGTIFTREVSSSTVPASLEYIDFAGRTVKTKAEGFNSTYYYTETEYNNRNLISGQTDVYQYSSNKNWNIYGYNTTTDGRLNSISFDSGAEIEYTYAANRITQKVNNKNYITDYDALGNITKVTNPLGSIVEYDYYSSGITSQVTTNGGNITDTVNSSGFVTAICDPYLGNSSYTYNAMGALTHSEDGEGNEFTYSYTDALNRITDIDNDNSNEAYDISYVSTGNGKGQLQEKTYTDGNLPTAISYTYDSRGRILTEIKEIGTTRACTLTYSYYDDGKLWTIENSEVNKTTEYIYNTKGFLTNIKYDGTTVWTLLSETLALKQEKLGSNITVASTYDEYGNPISTNAGSLLTLTYNFNDATGNLTSRTKGSLTENFSYDDLNRLTNITGSGSGTDVGYDASIKERMGSKSDAGDPYEYDDTKKYQLDKIQNPTTTLSSLPAQTVTYTSFNKVKTITQGDYSITFWYGPNQERCKMEVKQNGSELYTKYYFGNYEIKEQGGSVVEKIVYLTAPTGIIGFNRIKTSPAEDNIFYTLKDYLGSIMVIANASGTKLEEYSYDAWGRRRNKDNWTYSSVSAPTYITRGYTGHEHIEEVGLINMNGRVYDPLVGLFLSPDPIVQSPYDVLNYNRYSYVGNNPLKYTDPSGYYKISEFIKSHGYTWPNSEGANSDMTEYDSFTYGIGGSFEDYNTYCTNAETGDGMWIKNSSMVHREGAEAYKFLVGMLSNPEFSNSFGARSLGQFRGFDEHFFQRDNATGDFYIPYTNEVINPIDFLASLLQADAQNGGDFWGDTFGVNDFYKFTYKTEGLTSTFKNFLGVLTMTPHTSKTIGNSKAPINHVITVKNNVVMKIEHDIIANPYFNSTISQDSGGASITVGKLGISLGLSMEGITWGMSWNGLGTDYSWKPSKNFFNLSLLPIYVISPKVTPTTIY